MVLLGQTFKAEFLDFNISFGFTDIFCSCHDYFKFLEKKYSFSFELLTSVQLFYTLVLPLSLLFFSQTSVKLVVVAKNGYSVKIITAKNFKCIVFFTKHFLILVNPTRSI